MLFTVSTVLGFVSMGSSLLLVYLVIDSVNDGSLFASWGLPVPVRAAHTARAAGRAGAPPACLHARRCGSTPCRLTFSSSFRPPARPPCSPTASW